MSMFDFVKNKVHSTYKQAAETIIPILKESQFEEKGVLTPDEFVSAGEQLIFKCPTWSWHAGDKGKCDFLPDENQFLITRQVPCPKRVAEIQKDLQEEMVEDEDGDGTGWCITTSIAAETSKNEDAEEEITSMFDKPKQQTEEAEVQPKESSSQIMNLDDYAEQDLGVDDDGEADLDDDFQEFKNSEILRTRTYDISITYDKYYQVPHVWLRGYDEYSNPLTSEQILEDISSDHAHKTATVENHPHLSNVICVSIHPCRHAEVMKILSTRLRDSGAEIRVDQYVFLFLKFLSAIVPTVHFDYTQDVKG